MNFTNLLASILKNKNPKFVVIIGSGFHSQAFDNEKTVLTNWETLLKRVYPKVYLTHDYTIDFETIVRSKTVNQRPRKKYASLIEKEILKKVAEEILKEKYEKNIENYPMKIFNAKYVSDVISLNFDTVPERVLSKKKKFKCLYPQFNSEKELNELERNALLYHKVEGIRFWHPHGTVEKPSSILLGMRRYGQRIQMIERLRKQYKSKSKDGSLEIEESNWYDLLTTRPIIICGASLSNAEWDIWTALVNRSRNYARYPKNQQPIYIMTDNPGMYEARNPDNVNYFIPITSKKESFAAQWKKLEELFSK